MAAIDACEPQVIRALEKAGWQIHLKPYPLLIAGGRLLFADFSLQRYQDNKLVQIIVLEVKCFADPRNDLQEFYTAVGQYRFYSTLLAVRRHYPLYLAMPVDAYVRLIQDHTFFEVLLQSDVKLLIVDIEQEVVTEWIN